MGKNKKKQNIVEKVLTPYEALQDCLVIIKKEKIRCENVCLTLKNEYKHVNSRDGIPVDEIYDTKFKVLDCLISITENYANCFNERKYSETVLFVSELVKMFCVDNEMVALYNKMFKSNETMKEKCKALIKQYDRTRNNIKSSHQEKVEANKLYEEQKDVVYATNYFNKLIDGIYNNASKDYKNIPNILYKYVLDEVGVEFYNNYSVEMKDSEIIEKLSDKYRFDIDQFKFSLDFDQKTEDVINLLRDNAAYIKDQDVIDKLCNQARERIKILVNDLNTSIYEFKLKICAKPALANISSVVDFFLKVTKLIKYREFCSDMLSLVLFEFMINSQLLCLEKKPLIAEHIENQHSDTVVVEDLSSSSSYKQVNKDNEINDDKDQLNMHEGILDTEMVAVDLSASSASNLDDKINDSDNDNSVIFSAYAKNKFKKRQKYAKNEEVNLEKEQNSIQENRKKVVINLEDASNDFVSIFGMRKKTCSYKSAKSLINKLGGKVEPGKGSHNSIVFKTISDNTDIVIGILVRPHNGDTELDHGAFKTLKSNLISILPSNWFSILNTKFNMDLINDDYISHSKPKMGL